MKNQEDEKVLSMGDRQKPRTEVVRGFSRMDREPHYLLPLLEAFNGLSFTVVEAEAEAT
ncbi:MAG TPA: hypothetical protein PKV75_01255 [Desulfobacterales bacterium]|nr:hypothetical protein [Desulfobacterales bacterium]